MKMEITFGKLTARSFVEKHALSIAWLILTFVYAADAIAPPGARFDIFYLVPIATVAWYRKSSFAYLIALVAMLGDIHNSILEIAQGGSQWIAIYRAGATLLQFSVFCFVVLLIRRQFDQLKRSGDMLRHIAFHDRLTGLPNRPLLFDRLARAISQARRNQSQVALMVLDLDGFKQVNDRFGHQAGDDVLKAVAARLTGSVREVDTVARLGGDEFAIVLADIHHPIDASRLAQKVLDALSQPIPSGAEEQYRIGCSIGISLFPDDGSEIDSLLAGADEAMYASKAGGKNRYTLSTHPEDRVATTSWMIFHPSYESGIAEIDSQHRQLVELINRLNNAINSSESPGFIARTLDELIAYTELHFSMEEALMQKYDYPDFLAHKTSHAGLLADIEQSNIQLETPEREIVVLQTLKGWLISHVEFSDKVLADYLRQCGA
jgi:diguanylate cyclase (GGDEF)-like protein/hemerythrin-like metal-binding protein